MSDIPIDWTCIPGRVCGGAKMMQDAAVEIERLAAVLKDREAEIKSLSGHLIYSTDRIATMEEIIATHVGATIDDEETVAVILECYEKWLALQEDKNGSA